MSKRMKITITGAFVFAAVLFLGQQSAFAQIIGKTCNACHTMHNSQDGTSMIPGTDAALPDATVAQDYLLMFSCLGCHTQDGNGAAAATNTDTGAPAIMHTSAPADGDYLAGGTFYYPDQAGSTGKGHNVVGIRTEEVLALVDTPPGDLAGMAGSLDCVDSTGFTGCHVGKAHHTNKGSDGQTAGEVVWVDGGSAGSSFRFLSGVRGGEHNDWEWSNLSATQHNVYISSGDYDIADTASITSVCIACHGNFHGLAGEVEGSGAGSSPWVRHPTDIPLPATGEYAAYLTYDPVVPVGATTMFDGSTNDAAISPALDGDVFGTTYNIVLCQSCHRAHGSPYTDMLRFSYGQMSAGSGGTTGCFVCHTTK